MDHVTKTIRWLWRGYLRWEATRLLRRSLKLNPDIASAYIMERAAELGTQGAMAYLAREGIMTCCACPSRDQLRRVGKAYACPKHVAVVTEALKQEKAPKGAPAAAVPA